MGFGESLILHYSLETCGSTSTRVYLGGKLGRVLVFFASLEKFFTNKLHAPGLFLQFRLVGA